MKDPKRKTASPEGGLPSYYPCIGSPHIWNSFSGQVRRQNQRPSDPPRHWFQTEGIQAPNENHKSPAASIAKHRQDPVHTAQPDLNFGIDLINKGQGKRSTWNTAVTVWNSCLEAARRQLYVLHGSPMARIICLLGCSLFLDPSHVRANERTESEDKPIAQTALRTGSAGSVKKESDETPAAMEFPTGPRQGECSQAAPVKPKDMKLKPAASGQEGQDSKAQIEWLGQRYLLGRSQRSPACLNDEYFLENENPDTWSQLLAVQKLEATRPSKVLEQLRQKDRRHLEILLQNPGSCVLRIREGDAEQVCEGVILLQGSETPTQPTVVISYLLKPAKVEASVAKLQLEAWKERLLAQARTTRVRIQTQWTQTP